MFITIEGIEGAGKSTLRSKLVDQLDTLNRELIVTREPGATNLGQVIRSILLGSEHKNISPIAELMLFLSDRAQHIEEVIKPALAKNAIVICDRFVHSTIAYQGYARGLSLEILTTINKFITADIRPDIVLLLDLDPKIGLQRAAQRTRKATGSFHLDNITVKSDEDWNKFEAEALDFHSKVRNGFLDMAKDPSNNFLVLDATEASEVISEKCFKAINAKLK